MTAAGPRSNSLGLEDIVEQEAKSPSIEELREAIVSFVDGYSIEVTPHDEGRWDAIGAELSPGTPVFVAHPPGTALEEVLVFAERVRNDGFEPVPHIIARKIESRAKLQAALETFPKRQIRRVLVVAGDEAVENNEFDSSLEVLKSGLLEQYGVEMVGVSGHPEGSKAIGEKRVREALAGKADFAESAPFDVHIFTQFGFDPAALTAWEAETTGAGVRMPVHVGMAGPASLRQLFRFAMLCGVGASAKMAMKRTGATANLLKTQAPDELITHVARHRIDHPETRLKAAHLFCFGGVAKTARWMNAVRAGKFRIDRRATGFEVES